MEGGRGRKEKGGKRGEGGLSVLDILLLKFNKFRYSMLREIMQVSF